MKRDPAEYQIMVEGKVVMVSNATREDLEQELMKALDLIQKIETKLDSINDFISKYTSGKEE